MLLDFSTYWTQSVNKKQVLCFNTALHKQSYKNSTLITHNSALRSQTALVPIGRKVSIKNKPFASITLCISKATTTQDS